MQGGELLPDAALSPPAGQGKHGPVAVVELNINSPHDFAGPTNRYHKHAGNRLRCNQQLKAGLVYAITPCHSLNFPKLPDRKVNFPYAWKARRRMLDNQVILSHRVGHNSLSDHPYKHSC